MDLHLSTSFSIGKITEFHEFNKDRNRGNVKAEERCWSIDACIELSLSPLRERFVTGASYRLTIIIEQSRLTKRGRGRYSKDGGIRPAEIRVALSWKELRACCAVHRSAQSNRKTFVLDEIDGSPFPAPRFVKPTRNRFESWLIRFRINRLRPGSFLDP